MIHGELAYRASYLYVTEQIHVEVHVAHDLNVSCDLVISKDHCGHHPPVALNTMQRGSTSAAGQKGRGLHHGAAGGPLEPKCGSCDRHQEVGFTLCMGLDLPSTPSPEALCKKAKTGRTTAAATGKGDQPAEAT